MEKAKYEISATIAITSAIVLLTGWTLTWARLANEKLPSQNILAALPRSYFLQVSLQSTLSPLVVSVVGCIIWLAIYVPLHPTNQRTAIGGWCGFGILLALVSYGVAVLVNGGQARGSTAYVVGELAAGAGVVVVAGVCGLLVHIYVGDQPPKREGHANWDLIRPVAGSTVALCFLAVGLLRTIDARYVTDVLPVAKVVLAMRCSELTNGRPVTASAAQVAEGASAIDPSRCEVGGFYLGESSDWIYLIQRSYPCGKHPSIPLLLDLRRDSAEELVVFEAKLPPCHRAALAPDPRRVAQG
jgi:hypothetical protein